MAVQFLPHRGKKSTMNSTKADLVLAAGELFVEYPDSGIGTGVCKFKIGDGKTKYSELPYAIGNGGEIITISEVDVDSIDTAIALLVSGKSINDFSSTVKKTLQLLNTAYSNHSSNKSNPHGVTAAQLGLGKVGNFKAVSTENSQGLNGTEQANARANIGAGTSSFSGAYNDLSGKPTLGTAAAKDAPAKGNAASTEVVLGSDTRLSDARPASDVPSWAKAASKPSYSKSEVGLGNVGNFKAVSTVASQGLTDTEKANARANIGAGTGNSNFSGSYNDLNNKPALGSAAAKNVPASGNATIDEVVMGNDSRLTNSRPASDVAAWAKAANKPAYTATEVGLGNVGNFKAVSTVASQGLTDTEKANARANIGAGTGNSNFSGAYADLSGKPTLGTAAAKNIATSGNASTSQVVMGNDTRLSDARPASDVYAWAKAANKPTYTATEVGALANTITHLSGDIATSQKGAANGVATLDSDGKVPSSQLPSYVDDVLEYASLSKFPTSGESGKIYVSSDTNKTYRWSGTAYVEISPSIVVGTTTGTAFDGGVGNAHVNNKSNPHGVTAAQVGLGNVGNFKAVSTVASQKLTDTEKANARANIGAGTGNSNFSGAYADLSGKPTLGTAAAKNVPASGNAASSEVVLGNDTRLSNARPASDVSAWAKAASKPTYSKSEVGLGNVGNFKAVSTVASQGLSDTEKANARANIGAGTGNSNFDGNYNSLSNKPTIPSVGNGTITIKQAGKQIATFTVNQSSNTTIELTDTNTDTWRPLGTTADTACAGNDSRLSNSRPASDVYAWAKASTKPTYSKSEVGLGNVDNTADANKSVKYAISAGSATNAGGAYDGAIFDFGDEG